MTRAAAEIGRGLVPARPARAIRPGERIHVLGAAGAGASAAVLHAHHAGAQVSGCDPGGPSPYSEPILALGIDLEWRHDPQHVSGDPGARPERLAVTKALTAVDPDNAELAAARALDIPAEPWQQVIADAAATAGQRLVAVAGTHGKSTTSAWLVDALVRDGRDPSAFVGALMDATLTGSLPATARRGHGDVFVVEADEYAGNFDAYLPDVIVLLNAEWDHPDVFADGEAVLDAFVGWLRRATADGRRPTLIANIADRGARAIVERLDPWPGQLLTVGIGVAAEVSAGSEGTPGRTTLTVDGKLGPASVSVSLPGQHNAANGLMVYVVAKVLEIGRRGLSDSLSEFRGVGRRLELKGEIDGVVVLDDYGHHPTAITRTLEAVRATYPGRRLWAVYEPLTYHRTAAMIDAFADALAAADRVVIADIWAGRDPDTTITSASALAAAVSSRATAPAVAPGSVERSADFLAAEVAAGDVVLVMGGGRSYVIAERLVELLAGKSTATT